VTDNLFEKGGLYEYLKLTLPSASEEQLLSAIQVLGMRLDLEHYLSQNPDVAKCGTDPLSHYLTFGWKEKRLIKVRPINRKIV
jgi:hypothetical protein